jgi:propionate catabolism operon transcriptional regulator
VRELENVCERIAVHVSGLRAQTTFDVATLAAVAPEVFASPSTPAGLSPRSPADACLRAAKRDAELEHIAATVQACRGNVAEACRRLGIGRTTLWRKLREAERRQQERGPS